MTDQAETPIVQAAPAVYIDVVIRGQKQIYDVQTARMLLDQLIQALTSLQAPQAQSENQEPSPEPPPGDQTPLIFDDSPLDSREASRPDA